MKVLYISDSLGTPIHPRGIFNYSVSLIEILKSLGFSVDLLVEAAPGFGVDGRLREMGEDGTPAINSMRLSEIYRYFSQSHFSFDWPRQKARIAVSIARWTLLTFYYETLRRLLKRDRGSFVQNSASLIDFVPKEGAHLQNIDGFVLRSRFYWNSMFRAVTGLAPDKADAAGYDLVVVDTPHFVNVTGIAPERILTIVHDLIPLRDPTIDTNWRYLFVKKLRATLALRGTLVFVSEYTRDVFRQTFPDQKARRNVILYPATKASLLSAAKEGGGDREGSGSRSTPGETAAASDILYRYAYNSAKQNQTRKKKRDVETEATAPFDLSLPYFVTAVSDEPRKNVGILVKTAGLLKGIANFVVVGQIDANRHLGAEASKPGNILFTGYVSDSDKLEIFRGAAGVVFSSFAEGFGIPLVEGAIMGLPVLCSNIAVFREIAMDNAFYFDPYAPKSLAAAINERLSDPAAAARKAERMRESAMSRFSREAMAERLEALLPELGLKAKAPPASLTS